MKTNQLLVTGYCLAVLGGVINPDAHAQSAQDITTLPIAADEPIEPKGFPPLPAKLDLPHGSAFAPHNRSRTQSVDALTQRESLIRQQERDAEQQRAEQQRYQQEMEKLHRQPSRNEPRFSEATGPLADPPQGVTIDQSHSQDLSLPDDQQKSGGQNNFVNRIENRLQNNLKNQVHGPIRNFGGF
jgi:hypothetical protein